MDDQQFGQGTNDPFNPSVDPQTVSLKKEETSQENTGFNSNMNNDNNGYVNYTQDYSYEYTQPDNGEQKSTCSVISMVTGILSIVFCCCSIIGIIPGIIALIFASKAKKNGETSGMAIAGLVCGIIGLILSSLATFYYLWIFAGILEAYRAVQSNYRDFSEFLEWYMQNAQRYSYLFR